MADHSLASAFLIAASRRLQRSHAKIVHCVNQLDEAQIWWRPTPSQNSVGNLILHVCGNVRQWIISGVGGAADVRDRPSEFADDSHSTKQELLEGVDACIKEAESTLSRVEEARLGSSCRIQGFDTDVLAAILDTVSHFQGHTQEIISLTRQQLGVKYEFHWTPETPEQTSARTS